MGRSFAIFDSSKPPSSPERVSLSKNKGSSSFLILKLLRAVTASCAISSGLEPVAVDVYITSPRIDIAVLSSTPPLDINTPSALAAVSAVPPPFLTAPLIALLNCPFAAIRSSAGNWL